LTGIERDVREVRLTGIKRDVREVRLTGIERDVREVRLTGIERDVAGGSLSLWLQRRRRLPTPAQGCCNPGYTEQVNINADSVGQRFQRC
jgi:hypothetical protein